MTGPGDIAGDVVRGGAGNDRIRVRDGELDVISCGPGFDVAIARLRRRDRGRRPPRRSTATASGSGAPRRGRAPTGARATARPTARAFPTAGVGARDMYIGIGTLIIIIILLIILL